MTVGETLAEARARAGLSVGELGQRTRIRDQIIYAIEHDDFESCGGSLYVRGYVRVMAGAVGLDAASVLREFDKMGSSGGASGPARPASARPSLPTRSASPPPSLPSRSASAPPSLPARSARQPSAVELGTAPAPGPAASGSGWGAPPEPKPSAPRPSSPDSAGRFGRLQRLKRMDAIQEAEARAAAEAKARAEAEARAKAEAEARAAAAETLAQAAALAQMQAEAKTARTATPSAAAPEMADVTGSASATAVDLARPGSSDTVIDMVKDLGLSGSELRDTSFDMPALDDGPGRPLPPPLPAPRRQPVPAGKGRPETSSHGRGATAVVVAVAVIVVAIVGGQIFSGGGGSGATGASTSTGSATANLGPHALTVADAKAWGPNGTADGDNPPTAQYPITPGSTQSWITQQYSSAQFGGEKTGTGVLLDMGKLVTVNSVTVDLGSNSGSALQLQAGTSPSSLAEVASASNVGGNLALSPGKPVHARYLLVWFTQLPQASDGQYQASVSRISVTGATGR